MLTSSSISRLIISLVFFIITGCSPQDLAGETAVQTRAESAQSWSTELVISGGFAGVMKSLKLDSSALVIIKDLKKDKFVRTQVNNNELAVLSELLGQQHKQTTDLPAPKFSSQCQDCVSYELSIRWQNQQAFVSLNDLNLNQSEYQNIVLFLQKILVKYAKK